MSLRAPAAPRHVPASGIPRAAWLRSPWIPGLLLGAAQYVGVVNVALNAQLQRFDEGVRLSTTTLLGQGQLAQLDFYMPYGWAYGVPGLPARWLFGDQAIAHHMLYALAPALLVCLVCVWAARRWGWVIGVAAALLAFPAGTYRYAMAWCALVGFLILCDGAVQRSTGRSLRSAIENERRRMAIAGMLLAAMGWVKVEYGVFAGIWVLFLARDAPSAAAWARVAVPSLTAVAAPYALMVALGGAHHLVTFTDYLAFRVGDERGRAIEWSAFGHWFARPGLVNDQTTSVWLSYFVGAAVTLVWVVLLALRVLGRGLPEDRARLGPFLAVIGALVLYVQIRTFSFAQGAITMPVYWFALIALPLWRWRGLVVVMAAGAALVVLMPVVYNLWPLTAYRTTKDGLALSHREEPVPKLNRIPLGETAPGLTSIHALWKERVRDRDALFTLNRRNDQATGNEAFLYWFLDARAGAWPVSFDPGLADAADVQRETVDELCSRRPPIVQHDVAYPLLSRRADEFGSRYLDQFVALSYGLEASTDLFRILLPGSCQRPEDAPTEAVIARREALLRADDLPAAGALSTLLIERARAANRPIAGEDVASAVLGGYWIPDQEMPDGRARLAMRALRDGASAPDLAAVAQARGPALVRLAAQTAYLGLPHPLEGPEVAAVAVAARKLVDDVPRWPAAQRNLFALQPLTIEIYRHIRAKGGESADLERRRFQMAGAKSDRRTVDAAVAALVPLLADRPLERARFLAELGAFYAGTGDVACANRALSIADRIPGFVAPPHGEPAACRLPFE